MNQGNFSSITKHLTKPSNVKIIKIFLTWTMTVAIFVTIVLNFYFESVYVNYIQNSFNEKHKQTIAVLENYDYMAKTLASSLYFNAKVSKLLSTYKPSHFEILEAGDAVQTYYAFHPKIHSVYILNGFNDQVFCVYNKNIREYTINNFFDSEIIDYATNMAKGQPIKMLARNILFENLPVNIISYAFYDKFADNDVPLFVIVNLSNSWFSEMIASNQFAKTFLLDENGKFVVGNIDKAEEDFLKTKQLYEQISNQPYGNIITDILGKKSFVSYNMSEKTGCYMVTYIPYSTLIKDINNLRINTILIIFLILLSILVLIIIFSKRLYNPIGKLYDNLYLLEAKLNKTYSLDREVFLKTLLLDSKKVDLTSIPEYSNALKDNHTYLLLLLRIDHYADFCNKYNVSDRSLLKYGLANITGEILDRFESDSVDLGDDKICFILNVYDFNPERLPEKLKPLLEDARQKTVQYLDLSFTSVISPVATDIRCMDEVFAQAVEMSNYRMSEGHSACITVETIENKNKRELCLTREDEKLIIDSLLLGKYDFVNEFIIQKIKESEEYEYSLELFFQIALTLRSALNTIESNTGTKIPFKFNTLVSDISSAETNTEVLESFNALFESIKEAVNASKRNKQDELVKKINDFVIENFADSELCVESLSEKFNISSAYLGRIYKNKTAQKLNDFINNIRLEAAAQLLVTQNLTLNDITEKIGYTNTSYFCTLFKKKFGVTPNEYKRAKKTGD